MKKLILIVLLIFSFTFQSLALIDIDVKVDEDARVNVKIESSYEKKPITIEVSDDERKYYIDQDKTSKDGSAEFYFKLEEDREYDAKINIYGRQREFFIYTGETVPKETVKIYIEGYKGVILSKTETRLEDGDTVLDVLERVLKEEDIEYNIKNGYVKNIAGQEEFDKGAKSGWMFSINDEFPEIGAMNAQPEDGDYIKWLYTEDLGADIGALDPEVIYLEDELERALGKARRALKNLESSEKDIIKAIEDIVDILSDSFSNIKNDEDAETLIYYAGETVEILEAAVEKVKSQKYKEKTLDILGDLLRLLVESFETIDDKEIKNKAKDDIPKFISLLLVTTAQIENMEELEDDFDKITEFLIKALNELEREKKLYLEISLEGEGGIKLKFPRGLLKGIFKAGIDKIEIKTKTASLNMESNAFDNKLKDREMLFKIDCESNELQNIVSLAIMVDGKEIHSLNKAIEVSIPYGDNELSRENIDIFLLKNDDIRKAIIGKYDIKTGSVKFTTEELGKFIIELSKKAFNDLDNHSWAKNAIEAMVSKGIVRGRNEGEFDPNARITRGEFTVLLVRMLKYDTDNDRELPFKDVDRDSWYYESVAAAYERGLIAGRTKTVFEPDGDITRQEMAKIIAKVLENKSFEIEGNMELNLFEDGDDIDSWAKYSAALAAKAGIITGMEDGSFAPREKASRAQAVVMLYRLYNLLKNI